MSAAADKRIAAIREKVREERALLYEFNKQIGADLKKQIKPASHYLGDVEGFFLDMEGVRGSIPLPPTSNINSLGAK